MKRDFEARTLYGQIQGEMSWGVYPCNSSGLSLEIWVYVQGVTVVEGGFVWHKVVHREK